MTYIVWASYRQRSCRAWQTWAWLQAGRGWRCRAWPRGPTHAAPAPPCGTPEPLLHLAASSTPTTPPRSFVSPVTVALWK